MGPKSRPFAEGWVKACLFDLDGCLYAGDSAKPDAVESVNFLLNMGIQAAFVSNNSSDNPDDIRQKLINMGFKVYKNPILTPAYYAGEFLKRRFGETTVFPLGSDVLRESLMKSGHEICTEETPAVVLISRDLNIDFWLIQKAVYFLQKGSILAATNLDYYHPGEEGARIVETGAIVHSIQKIIPQSPIIIGKPSAFLFIKALEALGTKARETLMIGDNYFTDIIGANNVGLKTAFISSGISIPGRRKVGDYTIESLAEMLKMFELEESFD